MPGLTHTIPVRRNFTQAHIVQKLEEQMNTCAGLPTLPCATVFEGYLTPQADHIKPVSLGGGNSYNNLRLLCSNCHGIVSSLFAQAKPKLEKNIGIPEQWRTILKGVIDCYQDNPEYEVETIVKSRYDVDGNIEFKVKWKGHNGYSWIPYENFNDESTIHTKYMNQHDLSKNNTHEV